MGDRGAKVQCVSDPRRPDPALSWQEKQRARVSLRLEQVRDRWRPSGDLAATSSEGSTSLVAMAGIAILSAALALGALGAWQAWAQRSAPPIDDQLPMLAETDLDAATDSLAVPVPVAQAPATTTAAPSVFPAASAVAEVVIVHVSGAVRAPGVVELGPEARVFEAVALAGGATPDADLDRINLAAPLVDGERIHVLALGEQAAPVLAEPDRPYGTGTATDGETLGEQASVELDINVATAAELETLAGVGPATARSIIGLRDERGPFLSVEELLDVPGIGTAKLALLRPYVRVGPG